MEQDKINTFEGKSPYFKETGLDLEALIGFIKKNGITTARQSPETKDCMLYLKLGVQEYINVDLNNLTFKNKKATHEDKILMLFIKNYGLLDLKTLAKYNIPRIALSRVIDKYRIQHPSKGIYFIYEFFTVDMRNYIFDDNFFKALQQSNNIAFMSSVYANDLNNPKQPSIIHNLLVRKGHNIKLEGCKLIECSKEYFNIGIEKVNLSEDISINIVNKYRCFCELVRSVSRVLHNNINHFFRTFEYKGMIRIISHEQLENDKIPEVAYLESEDTIYNNSINLLTKFSQNKGIKNPNIFVMDWRDINGIDSNNFDKDILMDYAKKLGIEEDVGIVYDLITNFDITEKEK